MFLVAYLLLFQLSEGLGNQKSGKLTLTIKPLRDHTSNLVFENDTFVSFNTSQAQVLLRCSSSEPISWEFYFNRLENYYSDAINVQYNRTVAILNSTRPEFTYTTELILKLRNTPYITKNITCFETESVTREVSSITVSSQFTKVNENASNEITSNLKVDYAVHGTIKGQILVPEANASSKCDIVHLVKELSPTKILWHCEHNGVYLHAFYKRNWNCDTIPECTHYFYPARTSKTCIKYLGVDEPCPAKCALSSSLRPMVMQCRYYEPDIRRMIPVVYSVTLHKGLPLRYYNWPWTPQDLEDMMEFKQLPSVIYNNDKILAECITSELVFAIGTVFALSVNNSLEILTNITNYVNNQAQRVYTSPLSGDSNFIGILEISCLAPVWNSSMWINKSQSIEFKPYTTSNTECGINEESPKVTILPITPAIYSVSSHLVLSGSNKIKFQLNCSFDSPVHWTFNFNKFEDSKLNNTFTSETHRILEGISEKYFSSLYLSYGNFKHDQVYTCQSITNPCVRTKVRSSYLPIEQITTISIQGYAGRKRLIVSEPQCRNIFYIRRLTETTFEWECKEPLDNEPVATAELPCKDPLTCANYFENAISDSKCIKFVSSSYKCRNCRFDPATEQKRLYPRYLYCGIVRHWRTYQLVFYSLTKTVTGFPRMYFSLAEADPMEMMVLSDIQSTAFVGQSLNLSCTTSSFYFANGADLRINPKGINTSFNSSMSTSFAEDLLANTRTISVTLQLDNVESGQVEIVCSAPHISSSKRTSKISTVNIDYPANPYFLNDVNETTLAVVKGDSLSLICDAQGSPSPEITWEYPKENFIAKQQVNREGYSVLLLKDIGLTSQEGLYKCTAKNPFASATKYFQVLISDTNSSLRDILIIVGVLVALAFAGFLIVILLYKRRWNKLHKFVQILTEQEVVAFLTGDKAEHLDLHETITPVFAIPYDHQLEIPRSKLIIEESNILGLGEFGAVFKGRYETTLVAVKTTKRNIQGDQFKAILSEIKIMTYIGSHDHIVSFIGACTDNIRQGEVYIAIELCDNGSLYSFLSKNRCLFRDLRTSYSNISDREENYENLSVTLTTQNFCRWAKQIAHGMEYLEFKKVIHGDLATRNVLLTGDFVAKISDFGLSRQLINYASYIKTSHVGCPLPWRWMSLEALRYMTFSHKSDVWSYGVTIWEIFTLAQVPYTGVAWNIEFLNELANGIRLSKPEYACESEYQIMVDCWNDDPDSRPSFTELKVFFETGTV